MRDLFDEFMDELRRRQGAEQQQDDSGASAAAKATEDDDATGRAKRSRSDPASDSGTDSSADSSTDSSARDDADPEVEQDEPRPRPLQDAQGRARGGRGGPGGRGRDGRTRVGGPNDGGGWGEGFGRAGRRLGLVAAVVVVVFLLALSGSAVDLATDNIWYRSIGYDNVFWTRLNAQFGLFALVLVLGLIVLLGNLWLAGRLVPAPDPTRVSRVRGWIERMMEAGPDDDGRGGPFGGPFGGPGGRPPGRRATGDWSGRGGVELEMPDLTPVAVWIAGAFGLLIAFALATSVGASWETVLLWRNQVPFGADPAAPVVDPVFRRDISFFLFDLPFLRLAQSVVNALLLTGLVVSLARYLAAAARGGFAFVTPVRVHLAVLAGLYLLSIAAGYQLDKYELAYSTNGWATGVGYTDQNARFFALDVLTVITGLAAALLIGGAFTQLLWPLGLAIGAWVLASIVLSGVYPEIVQRFSVTPNEFAQERTYIANNIAMTRLGFGLDRWETRTYEGEAPLEAEDLAEEAATFRNARLWDYRPLGLTLGQIQTVRQYYDFADVDTDRYVVNGETRQVMLSARELAQDRTGAASWVNQRLTYTHGVGVTMVPVNEVTSEGLPRLWIRDLPPVSAPGIPVVTQPRIYFGERPSTYVVVNARQPEFDFPSDTAEAGGEEGTTTSWTGRTGVRLDSTFTRLLFALRFRDLNLFISDQITADSQLLLNRSLRTRITRIAPFLRYDRDPYLVVGADGRLIYIQDAYTTSDRFPHATPFSADQLPENTGLAGDRFNYIRNSVKIVMNAYDGSTTFYAADPNDPILRAYMGVFPGLFRPLSEVPADLLPHLRVPEELFNVQTRVFATYHVTQPERFYQGTDVWTVPTDAGSEQSLPTEAYYVVMRMPGEPEPEFLLLQPMVPQSRPNMISWVAARNDGDARGQVRVYQFPQDTSILGPNQIEAQISADPAISQQITLWNQSGSQVIRGNLLVVPIQDSILYLQPVYLQATSSALPQFQRIIVASPTRITWANTLTEALRLLLEGGPTPTPGPSPSPGGSPAPSPGASPSPGGSPAATPVPSATPGTGAIPPPPAGDIAALVAYANEHFELAQAALRAGDFARYGAEMEAVEEALRLLGTLVESSPAP